MKEAKLVHIIPTVPPAIGGLGSYCRKIWEHWPTPRPQWVCLTPDLPVGAREMWPEATLLQFERSEKGLLSQLRESEEGNVVLHYVGYGYHPKGSPVWLPRALRKWKQSAGKKARLTVMFHELYSTGARFSSSYFLSPLARGIVRQLVGLADHWVTSCPEYQMRLIKEMHADPMLGTMLPIGADIMPDSPVDWTRVWPLSQGKRLKVVVFGQPNTRLWTLTAHQNLLRELCQRGLVEALLLMGKRAEGETEREIAKMCASIEPRDELWKHRNDLSVAEISIELMDCDLGLIANHPGVLTKSLVYAALCNHGILPVCVSGTKHNTNGHLLLAGIENDDTNPQSCLHMLNDASRVVQERDKTQESAQCELNWSRIVKHWAQIVG